jgi:hypothetical protein
MPYDYSLDLAERDRLAQWDGVYPDDDDTPQLIHLDSGKLCPCGMKCSEHCQGGQNCLSIAPF